jgi:hypothetical protein
VPDGALTLDLEPGHAAGCPTLSRHKPRSRGSHCMRGGRAGEQPPPKKMLLLLLLHDIYSRVAIASISTLALRGRVFTANVARAGGFSWKYLP